MIEMCKKSKCWHKGQIQQQDQDDYTVYNYTVHIIHIMHIQVYFNLLPFYYLLLLLLFIVYYCYCCCDTEMSQFTGQIKFLILI